MGKVKNVKKSINKTVKNNDGIMSLPDRFREPAVAASRCVGEKAVCLLS